MQSLLQSDGLSYQSFRWEQLVVDDNESKPTSVLSDGDEQGMESIQESRQASPGLIQDLKDYGYFLFTHFCLGVVVSFAYIPGLGLFALSLGMPIPFLLPIYDPSSPISVFLLMGAIIISSSVLLGLFCYICLDMVWPERPTWSWKAIMLTGFLVLLTSVFIAFSFTFIIIFVIQQFQIPNWPMAPFYLMIVTLIGVISHQISKRIYSRFRCLDSVEPVHESRSSHLIDTLPSSNLPQGTTQ